MTRWASSDSRTGGVHRRLAAQRNQERVKLFAATANTVAITAFGAAFILPMINDGGAVRSRPALIVEHPPARR